ncbi:MAG: pyruvate dehydrogenase complex dihydrolipoamide acetyltransferase [Bacteroidota bacterium]|nr:pyruvate dehydrogenase complex dihydrolipoamide acetyltransferase [Bacteroidota bacterium]
MAQVIRMPKLSDTMTDGVVASWNKKVGDTVKRGEILAEIETDKATMEFESFYNGTLLYIGIEKGQGAPVDAIIAIIGEKDEDVKAILAAEEKGAAKKEEPAKAPAEKQEKTEKNISTPPDSKKDVEKKSEVVAEKKPAPSKQPEPVAMNGEENGDGRIKASPLAKKIAAEKGIDLQSVQGSGGHGRVIKRDIDAWHPSRIPPVMQIPGNMGSGKEGFTEENVSQMRKTIAKRLSESKFTAPHFYLTMEIDMENAVSAREAMNLMSAPAKISFNDMVIRACAASLRRHPKVNSSWLGDKIRYNQHIHIGVAVAVEDGLLVPVVRFADQKSFAQINAEVKTLAQKAKDKKLQPAEWEGNTFTISNLGMFGIEEFTAIINPPDACILAVGGIKEVPVVKNGQVVPGKTMKVTLSCDHRVVDGATGAAFLQTLKMMLENPVTILM